MRAVRGVLVAAIRRLARVVAVVTLGMSMPALAQMGAEADLSAKAAELERAGDYAKAISLAERALAIREKALGLNHFELIPSLDHLAALYAKQARYAEAERLYKRSQAIAVKLLGPNDPLVAYGLAVLADLYRDQGRSTEAETLCKRSLAMLEKAFGPEGLGVSTALNVLANLYGDQHRYAEAELLYKRSLAIEEKVYGPHDYRVAQISTNLAGLYWQQGRDADAEPLYHRTIAILTKAIGPDHPDVLMAVNNLALLYERQGRYAEAERLQKRSLSSWEKAFGPDHPLVARALSGLAELHRGQVRYADAEPLYKRSLAIREKAFGPDHPEFARGLNNFVNFYRVQNRYVEALPLVQRVLASGRAQPAIALPVLLGAQRQALIAPEKALDEALNVVQRANQTSAAAAVGKLAVRLAAGNDRLAELVRRDQDLSREAEALDKVIVSAVSKEPAKRDAAAEQRTRDRLAAVAVEQTSLQRTFASEFPDYAALSNPQPLRSKQIQPLLSDDEALVVFSAGGDNTSYVFALTRDRFEWTEVPLGGEALSDKVAAFRRGLDVNLVGDSNPASGKTGFDLGIAHELYLSLFGPVEALIKDKKQLLVVPSGALSALPFHLLVSEKPAAARPDRIEGYRDAAWLIKRQALAVLPSLASLRALRAFGQLDQNRKPLVGFGDPVFNPAAAVSVAPRAEPRAGARNLSTRAYTDFWQGAAIDRAKLSQQLPVLPDTAVELKSIAQKLGAAAADLHFGRDASEKTVKRLPLAEYRIVYFATHALVAGDVKGVAEPSLVLSIPANPTEFDDGLLTASEVAQLKLNADWVVLSACNTIAGDKPGAEALSGLARSFFYAGARALLVSHWAVESAAATRLTTSTFEILKSDPKLGRAEALRQAMLDFLNDTSSPENAHPAIWGPFALIGESRAK